MFDTIRVFLVDDHEVVRRGLAELFSGAGGMTVVGEAGDVSAALARIPAARPHVAVVDVRLPDGNGVELCRRLRRLLPDLRVVMLSAYDDDAARGAAADAGASGFLLKQAGGRDLVDAVGLVATGVTLFAVSEVLAAREPAARDTAALLASLTPRESRVFLLLGHGLTNRQIAARLGLQEKTVKNHVTHILGKLGMSRRTQVAVLAARLRLPPD